MLDENEELTHELNVLHLIERVKDNRNRSAWPLFVVKFIIKILDNIKSSSVIAKNLASTCRLTCPSIEIIELSNINFI